jgi:RNA recognition motif-containing protein
VRNIGFDMNEKHLRQLYQKYGQIDDVHIPTKTDRPTINRGFAFVEFSTKEMAEVAIKESHNSKWKGRTITSNFSVPKGSYEHRIDSVV